MSLLLPRRRLYTNVAALGKAAGGGGADTAEALAFIARTSPTLTGSDATNIKALINSMVNTTATGGGTLWSRFDMLFIWALPDTANAQLNLPNSTYTASLTAAPTFTAYRGYTGNGSTSAIITNFNASTATSPQFTQNSAHMSIWVLTNLAEAFAMAGDAASGSALYPNYAGTDAYARINDGTSGPGTVVDARGFLLGNRSGASAHQVYKNGSSILSDATASSAVANAVFQPMFSGTARQTAAFSSGASLSATDVSNFYGFLRTYMTAVGVP